MGRNLKPKMDFKGDCLWRAVIGHEEIPIFIGDARQSIILSSSTLRIHHHTLTLAMAASREEEIVAEKLINEGTSPASIEIILTLLSRVQDLEEELGH